ncbi:MAG: CehA/McbA family metallohydrolase [Vicinamibacterales bacterium]
MRTTRLTTAALVAAVVMWWVAAVPPAPRLAQGAPNPELRRRTIAGAFHVHSTLSDGTASQAEIAAAAARAGLQFVVFTDHGDATRTPAAPRYVDGVLCLDAVEISTNSGHYVAIGLPPAPYRLGGEAKAVAEDVRRLGGFGIIAHPDSVKRELAWRDWEMDADGLEWLNADSAWRSRSWPSLARTMLGYWVRPGAALAAMVDRPLDTLSRWDAITARRVMPAFAALDAHGGVGRASAEGGRNGVGGVPSYQASFESFSTRAILRQPPVADALADAAALVEAIRAGRSYTVVDGVGKDGWVEVGAERPGGSAVMGETLTGTGPATLRIRTARLSDSDLVILRNGSEISRSDRGDADVTVSQPGAYRVEIRQRGAAGAAPWILTNPIYIDLQAAPAAPRTTFTAMSSLMDGDWRTEHDPASQAALIRTGSEVGMTYRLDPAQQSPFAALVVPIERGRAFNGVSLTLSSKMPARVSLQFRSADGSERWRSSVVASVASEPVTLRLSDFVPVGTTARPLDDSVASSLLLVADLVNFLPGSQGGIVVHQLSLGRVE